MSLRVVSLGTRDVVLTTDDALQQPARFQALLTCSLVDELDGDPAPVPTRTMPLGHAFEAPHVRQQLRLRAGADGVAGVAAVPRLVCPAADILGYEIGLRVDVPGYHPREILATYGPFGPAPAPWSATDLGQVELHREALTISGTVVERTLLGPVATAGATVRIESYRRALPSPALSIPFSLPDLVSIDPPLYAARGAGTDALRQVTLAPSIGVETVLRGPAAEGSEHLRVEDASGMAAGDLVELEHDVPARREIVSVVSIDGLRPATVRLAHPLLRAHPLQASARRTQVTGIGAPIPLTQDGERHDRTLLTSPLGALPLAGELIVSGSGVPELHTFARYEVQSDPEGFYRLPPIDRVLEVRLSATAGALASVPTQVTFAAGETDRTVDLELT